MGVKDYIQEVFQSFHGLGAFIMILKKNWLKIVFEENINNKTVN